MTRNLPIYLRKMNNNKNQNLIKMPLSKRVFDIFFSLVVILITLPITTTILFCIFIEHIIIHRTFTSLFYSEKRISQGKEFNLIKFNIFKPRVIEAMKERGEFIHTKPLERDRNNLTYIGEILQKTYIDEFPQFFSILNGDISLVGPRPVNLEVYQDLLDKGIYTKTVIKTGLTGVYQSLKGITKRGDIELDEEYIEYFRNNSPFKIFIFDLKIILRTFKILFRAQGI